MASLKEMMQDIVNKDYDELLYFAQRAMVDVMPECKAVDPDNDGVLMLTSLILTAVAADGTLTALEKKLLHDVTGLDDAAISKMIAMYDSRMVDLADTFVDNMGSQTKAHALALILAFAAVDEKISRDEIRLINKLMD